MEIALLTDIHITSDHRPAHEVDVAANFSAILEDIGKDPSITHLILAGDLCFRDGSAEVMEWVRSRLEGLQKPFFVIPGNHDDVRITSYNVCYTKLLRASVSDFSCCSSPH